MNDPVTIRDVISATAKAADVPIPSLLSRSREKRFYRPRMVAMVLCRRWCPSQSTMDVGRAFGRDHTTVIHATRKVSKALDNAEPWALSLDVKVAKLLNSGFRATQGERDFRPARRALSEIAGPLYSVALTVEETYKYQLLMDAGLGPVEAAKAIVALRTCEQGITQPARFEDTVFGSNGVTVQ